MRTLYADWEDSAPNAVAVLPQQTATCPDDRRLTALVGDLSVRDDQFRQWWGGRHVAPRTGGTTSFNHPVAGEPTPARDALTCVADPDRQLIGWSAEPDSCTYEGLRFLSSWATAQREQWKILGLNMPGANLD